MSKVEIRRLDLESTVECNSMYLTQETKHVHLDLYTMTLSMFTVTCVGSNVW